MTVDHRTASRLIQNSDGYNGQTIRLWSTPNGNYFVAGMNNLRLPDMNNRETFKLFSPRGNQEMICEKCKGKMNWSIEGATQGWRCPMCGWNIITTYIEDIDR